jgi:hypothetical protein
MSLLQRLMAHGFAGCLVAVIGAVAGAAVAFSTMSIWDSSSTATPLGTWQELWQWIVALVAKAAWVVVCTLAGAVGGFVAGAMVNVGITRRGERGSRGPGAGAAEGQRPAPPP